MRLPYWLAALAAAPLLGAPASAQVGTPTPPIRPTPPIGPAPRGSPFDTGTPFPGGGWGGPSDRVPAPAEAAGTSEPASAAPAGAPRGSFVPGAAGGPASRFTGDSIDFGSGDFSAWQVWWSFNRDPYLNLRRRVHTGPWSPTGDVHALGRASDDGDPRPFAPTTAQLRDKIVPALLQELDGDSSSLIVRDALLALGRIGNPAEESQLERYVRPFVADSNVLVAETALVALGLIGGRQSVLDLAHVLMDDDAADTLAGPHGVSQRMRAMSAYALGLAGNRAENRDVAQFATHNLTRALLEGRDGPRDTFIACVHGLALAGSGQPVDRELAETLLELFEDDPLGQRVRAHVALAMGELGRGAEPVLRTLLAQPLVDALGAGGRAPGEVRQSAVLALSRIADSDEDPLDVAVRAALAAATRDPDQLTRRFALIAVARVAGRPGDGEGHSFAGLEPARALLLGVLRRNRNGTEPWAGLALGILGHRLGSERVSLSSDANLELAARLEATRAPNEIGAYALALGLRRDRLSRGMLIERVESLRGRVGARGMCALALGLSGAREAVAVLRSALDEAGNQPALHTQIAIALALIGDPGLSLQLAKDLREATVQAEQITVLATLGVVGDKRAVDPLVAALGDEELTDFARANAARALGIMAERTDLPWRTEYSIDCNYASVSETWTYPGGTGILDYP